MSHHANTDASDDSQPTVRDALTRLHDALEDGASMSDPVREALARLDDESGDSSPEKAENSGSGEFACTCGQQFATVQARNGHVGGSGDGHRVPDSGDSSPEKPENDTSDDKPTPAEIREQADTDEDARELLRAHKYGREGWAEVFGTCTEPDCTYGANGFDADLCSRHEGEDADDTAVGGMTKAEYVADLRAEGVSATEAHTMATEIFG